MEENEEVKVEPKQAPKRVTKSKKPKVGFSPEEIETRRQAFLKKTRGGK